MTTKAEEVATPEALKEMPKEFQELVVHQLMVHTEGEMSGADDYIKLLYPIAPNIYEKKVCCDRAIEELDHFEKGAQLLMELGVDTNYMINQELDERVMYATEAVKKISSWPERAFFSFLGESAVLDHLLEMEQSSYLPIRSMLKSVIKEEKVHVAHGFRITKEYCQHEKGLAEMNEALKRWWPVTLDLFGRSDSKRSVKYVKWGLRQRSNQKARELFIEKTRPKLEKLGLNIPPNDKHRKFM